MSGSRVEQGVVPTPRPGSVQAEILALLSEEIRGERRLVRRPRWRSIAFLLSALGALAFLTGCESLLGIQVERQADISVDPAVVDGSITATLHNRSSVAVLRDREGCHQPLRQVVDGQLEPARSVPCAGISLPPDTIPVGATLTIPVAVEDAGPGTYRVWLRLRDVGGAWPESRSLSEPFVLP